MSFTSYCPCYVVVSIYVVGFFALWTIKKLTNSLNKLDFTVCIFTVFSAFVHS